MSEPVDQYYELRLEQTRKALEKNGFAAHVVKDKDAARQLVMDEIIPGLIEEKGAKVVGLGGSMTITASGIYDAVKADGRLELIDSYGGDPAQSLELRRKALLSDIFLTGTNAVVEDGCLVNLDGLGNRVAAMAFGPENVIVVVGRNKLCPDVDTAMSRIKEFAAPANSIRLDRKTPCTKTGSCADCSAPGRICNSWLITEKSAPKHRIHVVLIGEDLGL
ncbi:lactate utilization protein [Desulfobaculum sp. SPO524]|uniref:lactate utilization protein n=1 Tax=Desulfobaculum sp. SPO524 TaxID=3378071 RepID=UPI0038519DB9